MPPTGHPHQLRHRDHESNEMGGGPTSNTQSQPGAPHALYPCTRSHSLLLYYLSQELKRRLLSHFITQELGVPSNWVEATQLDLETQRCPESHAGNSGFEPHLLPVLEEPPP